MNNVIETLNNRMSLRKYKNEKISKEHLDIIIESAMRAPTAGNMMLYSILVIEDDETKLKLSKSCDNQPFIASAPVVLIFLADLQRWFDYYSHSKVKDFCEKNSLEFHTPDEGDFILASEDAVIAAQNAVIAAESLGIGSCYIGDIIENYELHKEIFNLPDWAAPISMLCLGYYPDDYKRVISPRFDRKFIVFNEKYRRLDSSDFAEMFKDKDSKVGADNIFKAQNFGQLMYARKTGSEFSKEMSRSAKLILDKWK